MPFERLGLNAANDEERFSERGVLDAEPTVVDSESRPFVSSSPRRSVKSGRETGVKAPSARSVRRVV